MNRYQYRVDAMHCQGCVKRMREAIQAEDAQAEVSGEPADHRLQVDSALPRDRIAQLLTEAGYPPAAEHESCDFTIPAMSRQGCVKRSAPKHAAVGGRIIAARPVHRIQHPHGQQHQTAPDCTGQGP